MYLAHICDNFLFMLTFLSTYSSIYVWPRSHKPELGRTWGFYSVDTATCQHNWPKLKQTNPKTIPTQPPTPNPKGDWPTGLVTNNIGRKQPLKIVDTWDTRWPEPIPSYPITSLSVQTQVSVAHLSETEACQTRLSIQQCRPESSKAFNPEAQAYEV